MAKDKETDEDEVPQKRRRPGDDEEPEQPVKITLRQRLEQLGQLVEQAKAWAEKNQTKAMLILAGLFLLFLIFCGLIVWRIISVRNRPTVQHAIEAFEFGAYSQAQFRARSVLRYAKEEEYEKRTVASYILGTSLLEQYEPSNLPEKESYYLAAANHLKEAYRLGFPDEYKTNGLLAYGKALYLSDSIPQAIEILLEAERQPQQNHKAANWFLVNAIMRSEAPDYNLALLHCDKYLADATLIEMESHRGKLLRAHILLKLARLDEANRVFDQVPPLDELEAYQEFVCAQLLIEEGRRFRAQAAALQERLSLMNSAQNQEEEEKAPEPDILKDAPTPSEPGERTLPPLIAPPPPLVPSAVRKPAPEPPQYETPSPRIEQAVVRRNQPPARIVQVRRQVSQVPETENPAEEVDHLRNQAIAKYKEAILRLEMSKTADASEFRYTRQSYLLQGICFEEMGEYDTAKEQYRVLIQTFPESSEAIAADFLRAEIFRKSGQFGLALTGHQRTVRKLVQKGTYQNPILTRKDMLTRINDAVGELMSLKEYHDAFELLAVYEPIMTPREISRIKAVGYESWAKMLHRNANAAAFEEQERLLRDARDKYRASAREYAVYAKYELTSRRYAELLWASAENYRFGKDYLKAIPMYREYLKNEIRLRQPETFALLGQMYFDLDLLDESIKTSDDYLKLFPNHPLLYQVRLIKSYAHTEKKEPDRAKELLLENLSGVLSPQAAEYRDSIYALGKLYHDTGDREKAITTLEDAVFLHPDAPQAAAAYYMIAQMHLKRIDDEQSLLQNSNLTAVKETATLAIQKARQAGHDNFQKARKILDDREQVIPLSSSERTMQMVCYFEIAKLQLQLGRLEEALESYNITQNRFQQRPETLDALIQAALIYRRLGRNEEAKETLRKGEVLLRKLKEANAFTSGHRFNEAEWNEILNYEL